MTFYCIEHDKKTAKFFKAVHKDGDVYRSSMRPKFTYIIGEIKTETCDQNVNNTCSYGINISPLHFALDFGRGWPDLAILEVEADIDKIVIPRGTGGKLRTSEVKVIREVPLDECGIYGNIILKSMPS